MSTSWCPACARRQPANADGRCSYCGHVGLVDGRFAIIRELFADLSALIPEIISFATGFASIPIAFHFFQSRDSWVKGAITICFVGTVVGCFLAPSRSIRMAVVSVVGQTVFVLAIPFLFRSWFPEVSSLNFAMTVIFINLVSPIGSALGSFVGLIANRLFFLMSEIAAGRRTP